MKTNARDPIHQDTHCILVEGSKWCDTTFYAQWLLETAKADALLVRANDNPSFDEAMMVINTDLFTPALKMVARAMEDFGSFSIVHLDEESDVVALAMMVEMGFFILTDQRYQMVIPSGLIMEKVKSAVLDMAEPEELDGLHPEDLVTTMPYAEAKALQARLRGVDEGQRCTDRHLRLVTP